MSASSESPLRDSVPIVIPVDETGQARNEYLRRHSREDLMAKQRIWRGALVVAALSLVGSGCGHLGAAQQVPVSPMCSADLKPTQPDQSAGLITVRPGFDAKKYPVIAIMTFPVTDSGVMNKEEAKLTVSIPPYLQLQIAQRLRASNAFTRVDLVQEGSPTPT